MRELLRTNDMVLVSFIEAILKEHHITCIVLDTHMSVVEGSLGILPRRIMVDADDLLQGRRVLEEAGISSASG